MAMNAAKKLVDLFKRKPFLIVGAVVLLAGAAMAVSSAQRTAAPDMDELQSQALDLEQRLQPCSFQAYVLTQALVSSKMQTSPADQRAAIMKNLEMVQAFPNVSQEQREEIFEDAFAAAQQYKAQTEGQEVNPTEISHIVTKTSSDCVSQVTQD